MRQRRALVSCSAFMLTLVRSGSILRLATAQPDRQSVILITLDGARTEEVFGGLDLEVFSRRFDEKQRIEDRPPTSASGPTRPPRAARS